MTRIKKTRNAVIKIEDLPKSVVELTPEMVKAVTGGNIVIADRVSTAYGTHDYITKTSHWDTKTDDVPCDGGGSGGSGGGGGGGGILV
jgi:hypothetical protein